MNKAIESVAGDWNLTINEFAVAGIQNSTLWAHQWYVDTEETIDEQLLSLKIDEKLKALNDDYRVERGSALTAVRAKALPNAIFYEWMKEHGKIGGQNKFPRVLKNEKLVNWEIFLKEMLLTS